MQQRDFLRDQIEQMGKVLGKVVAEFLDLKLKGDVNNAIEVTRQQLNSQLDLDINKLVLLSRDELEAFLLERQFTDLHMDLLAKLLFEVGCAYKTKENPTQSLSYLQGTQRLIQLAEKHSSTFTFDRLKLKNKINLELGL